MAVALGFFKNKLCNSLLKMTC